MRITITKLEYEYEKEDIDYNMLVGEYSMMLVVMMFLLTRRLLDKTGLPNKDIDYEVKKDDDGDY